MEQTIKKLKRIGRSALAIMIMLMLIITSLPGGLFSIAENAAAIELAGISGSLESKKLLQYDMKSAKYMQIYWVNYKESELLKDGSCTEASSPFHIYHINTGKAVDPLVFCMEHGVTQKNTTNMSARVYKESEMWYAYEKANMRYALENIKQVLFYGPVNKTKASELFDLGFGESKFYGQNGSRSDYDISAWVAATQCLVWECQQDFRDKNFNRQANGLYYQTTYQGAKTTPIAANHYTRHIAGTPAMDIYNFMASEIKKNNRFDSNVASPEKNRPQEILIKDDETFPITKELKGTANGSELEVVDEKGKVVKGISITFNKEDRKYILTVNDESLIGKTLMVRHKGPAAQRAAKYRSGSNKRYYEPLVWAYATNGGQSHTQGFVSGLDDPVRGYFKLTKNPPNIKLRTCSPLDVDVFPVINMPIEKVDANPGFDGDVHTPMGDAKLDAVATLERQIGGGAWETIKTQQFDDYGNQIVFSDQPFKSASDLTPYMTENGSLTYCGHYDDEGNQLHPDGEKAPTRRVWNVTVNYRITITRPDGRYVDPDQYGGVREYSINYSANTHDTCTMWCESDPWTPVSYTIGYGATRGDGGRYTLTGTSEADGGTIGAEQALDCDLETDIEDLMRGRVHLIKSNEKENPFKDSAMGGSDSNMSKASKWTVRLKSKGFENSEYIHLKSAAPTKLADGTNVYTVSRDEGEAVCDEQSPLVVGTNGAILIEDLPYGEYIITEVEADDPMYVLEQFTVVVSEHNGSGAEQRIPFGNQGDVPLTGKWDGYNKTGTNGTGGKGGTGDYYNNLYQVNLRDKIKSNQIQLQKVDSETGKIVRMEGTKVFIRYKGNPDYTDEENQKRYGPTGTVAKNIYNRFLPNAEGINSKSTNYTFELDENGCFDIEYELPYGKYEIYEWLLPEGYFVGEYDETGTASNHNFGFISEGQFTVDAALHGFNGVVPSYAIKDEAGNRVEYKDKSEYSFENLTKMVTNRYTFTVTKQDMHIDGNYSELVTYDGNLRTDADPTYEKSDYPFTKYYKVAAVINNAVKGKIAIEKEGEELSGFVKEVKDGRTIFTPIYEMGAKLKDAVFGIFAAEDINLNDGSEGPAIYDSKTGELITIPKTKSSHFSSAVESVKAFFGKLLNPKEYSASNYETGEYSHESGAELWYMLERQVSEGNIKRTIYITPEQKDTTYSYSYEAEDDMFNYRWDVQVILQNQAGGANVTDVKVTKVTSAKDGYVTDIPLTQMTGSVGAAVLDPLDSYMNLAPGADPNLVSALDAYTHTYTYEADGSIGLDFSGTDTDFSNIGVRRYAVKEYDYYLLTAADLNKEERKVGERQVIDMPGNDANGDGDFDDPEDTPPTYRTEDIKETRTIFEWNNEGWELVGNPAAGDRAVLREKDAEAGEASYKAAVTGYYAGTDAANLAEEEKAGTVKYTSLISGAVKYEFIQSDFMGEQIKGYEVPQGFTETAFTGNPKTEPRYVIAANAAGDAYKVLLSDGITWQDCTMAGNFAKAAVQVYEVKYTQVAGDPDGFTLNWDGFAIGSNVDVDTNRATTIITKHTAAVGNEVIDVGAGYEHQNAGDTITFNTIPITAPVYFAWKDGVKADMYYKGGVAYATIALPQSAVDYLYKDVVPTLGFNFTDIEGKDGCINLDWYSKLTPENPQAKFSVIDGLPEGCTVTATRTDSTQTGAEPTYFIRIVTNQKEDKPLRLTFADGYVMDVYCSEAASGNGVGVIDLYNIYKTTRYTKGELVETLTTDDKGKAESKLLPLGKYIVRELNAPEGYVTIDKENEVVLKYKDQFTPLVWQDVRESNPYMTVEIDLSKVFETAYKSDKYVPSGGATFGLYAGEELNTGKKDTTNLKGKIPAGSLLDVIVVDATGKAKSNIKLPYGTYYIKELSTLDTHLPDEKPYYFEISDDGASAPCEFDYGTDGISGNVVMEKYGEATITVKTEERYPMPNITVNGRQYLQSQDYIQDGLTIKASDDKTTVKVTAKDNTPVSLTLPNGKSLKVTVKGNTYEYTIDGVTKTYTPEVSFTGYYAAYEKAFEAQKPTGDEPQPIVDNITLKGAGENASSIRADVTHTPKEDKTGYTHSVVLSVTGSDGTVAVTGDIIRTVNGKDKTEALAPDGTISLAAGESFTAFDVNGAQIGAMLDETGKIKETVAGTLKKAVTDENGPKTTLNGIDVSGDMEFVKSVSLARQDHAAKTLQVKVNTTDNVNGGDIKNKHKEVPRDPEPEPDNTKGKIVITKTDSVTGKPLAGATFELWKSKREVAENTTNIVPDVLLETKTTDVDGKIVFEVELGTYFYREVSAPKNYILDSNYRQADVYTNFAVQVTVPNQPEGSTLIISKVSASGKPLAGAVFEIWSAKKVKGEYVKNKLITTATSDGSGEIAVSGLKNGSYFYHESKAPDGYVTNGKYHLFQVKENSGFITKKVVNKKVGTIEVFAQFMPGVDDPAAVSMLLQSNDPDNPKTGDTSNLSWWLLIAALAAVAIILLNVTDKREENEKKKLR